MTNLKYNKVIEIMGVQKFESLFLILISEIVLTLKLIENEHTHCIVFKCWYILDVLLPSLHQEASILSEGDRQYLTDIRYWKILVPGGVHTHCLQMPIYHETIVHIIRRDEFSSSSLKKPWNVSKGPMISAYPHQIWSFVNLSERYSNVKTCKVIGQTWM
jgi:hypothetical protein